MCINYNELEILENRTIRINLKKTIEDLLCYHISGDEDEVNEVQSHFEWFMQHSTESTKKDALEYIFKQKHVKENKFLLTYFEKFRM